MYSHNYQRLLTNHKFFREFDLPLVYKTKFKSGSVKSHVRLLNTTMPQEKHRNVAVILSGCGVYDGSEIHETAACFAALTRHGATPIAYSIDKDQHHVVAHNVGQGLSP